MFIDKQGLKTSLTTEKQNRKLLREGGLPIFKVRIVYKSGHVDEFWAKEFEILKGRWSWKAVFDSHRPVMMGVDEIESVWQVDYTVVPKNELDHYGLVE
jgi:hypothetical protein